jgi:hypothetical protein
MRSHNTIGAKFESDDPLRDLLPRYARKYRWPMRPRLLQITSAKKMKHSMPSQAQNKTFGQENLLRDLDGGSR